MTGQELKQCRESRDLSQAKFADKVGVSRVTIANNEKEPEISKRLQGKVEDYLRRDKDETIQRGLKMINDGIEQIKGASQ